MLSINTHECKLRVSVRGSSVCVLDAWRCEEMNQKKTRVYTHKRNGHCETRTERIETAIYIIINTIKYHEIYYSIGVSRCFIQNVQLHFMFPPITMCACVAVAVAVAVMYDLYAYEYMSSCVCVCSVAEPMLFGSKCVWLIFLFFFRIFLQLRT